MKIKKYFLLSVFLINGLVAMERIEEDSFFQHTQVHPARKNSKDSFIEEADEELHDLIISLRVDEELRDLDSAKNKFLESSDVIENVFSRTNQKILTLQETILDLQEKYYSVLGKYENAKSIAFKYKDLYENLKNNKLENEIAIKDSNKSNSKESEEILENRKINSNLMAQTIPAVIKTIQERYKDNFVPDNLENSFAKSCPSNLFEHFNGLNPRIQKDYIYRFFIDFFCRAISYDSRLTKEDIFFYFQDNLKEKRNIDLQKMNVLQSGYVQDALEKTEFVRNKRFTRSVRLPIQQSSVRSSSVNSSKVRVFKK